MVAFFELSNPLLFRQYLDAHDVSIQGSVLVLVTKNDQVILESVNQTSGFFKVDSGCHDPTLEVFAFPDTELHLIKCKMLIVERFAFCQISLLQIILDVHLLSKAHVVKELRVASRVHYNKVFHSDDIEFHLVNLKERKIILLGLERVCQKIYFVALRETGHVVEVPLVCEADFSLELVVETLAGELVVSDVGFLEVLVVEVIDLSLILFNKVLHSMERLDVFPVQVPKDGVR